MSFRFKHIYLLKTSDSFYFIENTSFFLLFEMGRKFYCDFCDKRLPSGLIHRKNHQRGQQHVQNQRMYYQQFKGGMKISINDQTCFYLDVREILYEERGKNICHQWTQTGRCSFGENCKYSHRSNGQLMQLNEQQINRMDDDLYVKKWIEKKFHDQIPLPPSLLF